MIDQKTVRDYIRTIPDFPHEGVMFRDVTTLFANARGFRIAIDQLLHSVLCCALYCVLCSELFCVLRVCVCIF